MESAVGKYSFIYLLVALALAVHTQGEQHCSTTVSLNFKDTVLINDSVFFLKDIAQIATPDQRLALELQVLSAGSSAPAGYSRFLNVDDFVLYRLKPHYQRVKFKITGCQRILIRTDYVEKKISDYHDDIRKYLEKTIKWGTGNWEMTIVDPDKSWKLLPGSTTYEISGLENPYAKGHVQVWINTTQGQRTIRVPVSCNLKVVLPVLIAKTSIERGQQITPGDCEFKKMDITRFGPEPIFEIGTIRDVRAVRSITAGSIIHTRMIQRMPVIEKGDRVEIIVSKGRVKVAVEGIAREAGCVGEKIWVENSASKKLIQTLIKKKGTVTVAMGGLSI